MVNSLEELLQAGLSPMVKSFTPKELRDFLYRIDLRQYMRNGSWKNLLAISHYREVEAIFYPKLRDSSSGKIKPNTNSNRVFCGIGWKFVVVVPLQRDFGEFTGVLLVGRQARYPDDFIVRLFGKRSEDTGFILPPATCEVLHRMKKKRDGHVILCTNPMGLLRTSISRTPLLGTAPLIGWINDYPKNRFLKTTNWSLLEGIRDKIFWTQTRADRRTIQRAIALNAKIIEYSPFEPYPSWKDGSPWGIPPLRPNQFSLMHMKVDAVPWSSYIARQFLAGSVEDAVAYQQELTLTEDELSIVFSRMKARERKRLYRLLH